MNATVATGPSTRAMARVGLAALGMAVNSCRHDCLALPCPAPLPAITIRVSAADADLVRDAVVHVSGASVVTIPCSAECSVPGYSGTYVLEVDAPGYQTTRRTVTVQGTNPECGCPTVIPEHLTIVLTVSP